MSDQTPPAAAPEPPPTPQPAAPLTAAEDQQWASFAHFGEIITLIGPLIIWLVFKDRGTKTSVEGKEALNFGITVAILLVGLNVLGSILYWILPFPIDGVFSILFTLATWAVVIANIVLAIMGGLKVQQGGSYRYFFNFRFIK